MINTITMDISQGNGDLAPLLLANFYKNLISDENIDNITLNLKIIDELLDRGFNINQKFPDNFLASSDSAVAGGTPLHFVYSRKFSIEIFNALMERGADFTLKNAKGQTILHCMIEDWRKKKASKFQIFINSVLSAHVKFQNIYNPSDGNGLTHFHCACMANHTQAIEFFMENGVLIDHAVSTDSKLFSGYTGLHFATEFFALEAVKILLDSKANAFAENENEMTPLQVFIESQQISIEETIKHIVKLEFPKFFVKYDKVIVLFLERDQSLTSSFFHFYAACSLQDVSWVEKLLEQAPDINQSISMDSSHWPGYTPLHFAAHCSLDMVKFLFGKGANIVAEDAHGLTPLNICLRYHSLQDVCSLLSNDSQWANTLLSDGKTKLLDLMANMNKTSSFRSFLNDVLDNVNSIVPLDSPFWPGYTCLHVALVTTQSYDDDIVRICLNYGSDVNIKNGKGQTPIHLAYRLEKDVSPLLEHLESLPKIVDILDEDDLSYLHIAGAHKNVNVIEKLLPTSDVNVTYKGRHMKPEDEDNCLLSWRRAVSGWTPLHFAARSSDNEMIKLLVDAGADVDAKDDYGLTHVHWGLGGGWITDDTFARDGLKDCVTKFGMSYLHVASAVDNRAAVERLIALGSKIDAVMDGEDYLLGQPSSSVYELSGFTPLELAIAMDSYEAVVGLMKNGAKMSVDDFRCTKVLRDDFLFDTFYGEVWLEDEVRDVVEEQLGFTRLHAACCFDRADARSVEELLDQGANVDAKVHAGSKILAGCTPLHLLMMKARIGSDCMDLRMVVGKIQVLLERGADVTIANVGGNTPVHLSLELVKKKKWLVEEAEKCTTLLMASQRDLTLNPVNAEGISHFHVACLVHNVEAVKGFLQNGVDVNQETDLFCEKYAKFTPLHFAFEYPLSKFARNQSPWYIVDLLLKSGANVQAQDARGNTPLHEACRDARADIGIFENLISFGADVRKENVRGETPLELLLSSPDVLPEQIRLFMKHGARFNDSNRLSDKGYIGMFIFVNSTKTQKTIINQVMRFSSDITRDERGRSPIHNTVAISKTYNEVDLKSTYYEIINWFIKEGIDIDDQDESGKTALHYAARLRNYDALGALLKLGADINIIDKSGESAFSYVPDVIAAGVESVYVIFLRQIYVRKMIGLEVSQLNRNRYEELEYRFLGLVVFRDLFDKAIEKLKNTIIGQTSLTLHDFLIDTKAVVNYPFMPKKIRDQIDEYFNSLKEKEFSDTIEIFNVLKSQYSKAVARVSLIEEATRSLRSHLGFSFPGLCEDITLYLSNIELKNLIKSAN